MSVPMDPAQALYNECFGLQAPMRAALARGDSVVQQWYEGTTAFVTGGSGYLGKLLIEKLIRYLSTHAITTRSCKLKKIYVLIRAKKGKSVGERLEELFQDPLFASLREEERDFENFVHGVKGDVAELGLGLSATDRETLIQEVDIIFHLAATVRFDEALKLATLTNVRGTRELLALAKECQKLKSLVHVSTSYTHATDDKVDKEISEQFYPSPMDPGALIELVETTDEKRLDAVTSNLIRGWPNTYTFTKAIAEELVRTTAEDLPICVFRPCIVFCTYYEPAPGYVDKSCAYSTTGIVLGVGMGVMRVLFTRRQVRICYVPADFATNATIVCGWKTASSPRHLHPSAEVKIYTLSSSKCNIGYHVISDTLNARGRAIVSPKSLWYNYLIETDNVVYYKVYIWLLHYFPAYIIDAVCKIFNIELPKGLKSFVYLCTKMEKMGKVFAYFLTNEWFIRDDNMVALYDSLSPTDKDLFCFDVMKVDWEQLVMIWGLGLRKYLIKDGLEGTLYARRKQQWLRVANYAVLLIYIYVLWMSPPMDPAQALYNECYGLQKPMRAALARGDSVVQQWYTGTTAFVTGGSGYLGKLLIEKLIRSCKLTKIYVLIRAKKGKTVEERLEELFQDPLFTSLREEGRVFENIVHGVRGDVAELGLGIGASDRQTLVQEVDIIFHLAATVRFDEALKLATLTNVRGTRELLALAKECQKLKSLVHVSTSYTHATVDKVGQEVSEQFYPSPMDPSALIELVETTDEKRLDDITSNLILGWPNTYAFTKAVSEELVRTTAGELPICVYRPSIVFCTYYEPAPGYVDKSCAYSTTGIILGVHMGIMRVLFTRRQVRLCYVPADFATNATIVCGWKTAISPRELHPTAEVKIYTLSSSKCNIGYYVISDTLNTRPKELMSPKSLWYNYLIETDNVVYYKVCTWLLHYFPAYVVDATCKMFNIKLPSGLKSFVNLCTKMEKMSTVFAYFLTNEWFIRDDNMVALYDSLTPTDKDLFCFDVMKVDWERMIVIWGIGVRKYLIKDGLDGTLYAWRKQQCLRVANYAVLLLYIYLFWLLINFVLGWFV